MDDWYKVIFVTKHGFIFNDDKKVSAFARALHDLMYYADEIRPLFVDLEGVQFLVKGDLQGWLTRLEVDRVLDYFEVFVRKIHDHMEVIK